MSFGNCLTYIYPINCFNSRASIHPTSLETKGKVSEIAPSTTNNQTNVTYHSAQIHIQTPVEKANKWINAQGGNAQELLFRIARDPGVTQGLSLHLVLKSLIKNGADVNAKGRHGDTPLHMASSYGNLEIAQLLIENGANVNAKYRLGMTPLHITLNRGHLEFAKLLIDHGADVNTKRNDDNTPLHWASDEGHLELAKLFIENGADVNAKDISNWTPLHAAAFRGNLKMAQLLIKNGADLNATDKDGQTPLHSASRKGALDIVQYFQKHLKTTFLAKLDSDIARLQKEGKPDEIDNLFNSPISLENVATADAEIILLNGNLYIRTELDSLQICPITRRKIQPCDKLIVSNEIKEIWRKIT